MLVTINQTERAKAGKQLIKQKTLFRAISLGGKMQIDFNKINGI
jgi:hypothetical protein